MPFLVRVVLLCLLAPAAPADAGSVFSFNGQGYPLRRSGPRATGMGGSGRALVDGLNMSSLNPALLGGFQRPAMSGTFSFQRRNVKDPSTSHAIADGDISGIKAVFPFRFNGTLAVGVEALTDVDVTLVDTVGTGGAEHLLGLRGTGGVGALVFGFGQKVGGRLFLGAQADLMVVGTLTEDWSKELLSDLQAVSSIDVVSRSQKGIQFSFGGIYAPGDLSIGLVLKPKATVTQRVLLENIFTTLGVSSSPTVTERDIHFPAAFGLGLAYAKSGRVITAVDYEYAAWGDTGPGRHDTTELAFGLQYQTRPANLRGIGRRYDLMAGVYRRSLYFATRSGGQISEVGATVGLGVPFKRQSGTFRWTLDVGRRGNTQSHGASETYFKQTLSISGWIQ